MRQILVYCSWREAQIKYDDSVLFEVAAKYQQLTNMH